MICWEKGGIYPRVPLVYVYIIIRHDTVLGLLLVTLFVIGGLVGKTRKGRIIGMCACWAVVGSGAGQRGKWCGLEGVYLGLVCEFPGLGLFNGWLM